MRKKKEQELLTFLINVGRFLIDAGREGATKEQIYRALRYETI